MDGLSTARNLNMIGFHVKLLVMVKPIDLSYEKKMKSCSDNEIEISYWEDF